MIGHDQDNFPKSKHPSDRINEAAIIIAWGALIWILVVGGVLYLLGYWP